MLSGKIYQIQLTSKKNNDYVKGHVLSSVY
jgi:hypothetical protein